jgi:hypothetical protein
MPGGDPTRSVPPVPAPPPSYTPPPYQPEPPAYLPPAHPAGGARPPVDPRHRRGRAGGVAAAAAAVALLAGLALGWGAAVLLAGDNPPPVDADEVAALQARLDELEAANTVLGERVDELEAANAGLSARGQILELAAAEAEQARDAAIGERDQALADLETARSTIATLEESLTAIDEAFSSTEALVGAQISEVRAYADNRQLQLVERETTELPPGMSPPVAPGTVVVQAPEPGTPVLPGSVVFVEVYVEEPGQAGG